MISIPLYFYATQKPLALFIKKVISIYSYCNSHCLTFLKFRVSADVVFLQEMTPDLVPQIRKNLSGEYSILVATPNLPYFTVVLLKPFIKLISHKAVPYGRSGMGRSMQLVEVGRAFHLCHLFVNEDSLRF